MKNKRTVKLFWKEVKEEKGLLARLNRKKTIWDEIKPVNIDCNRLEVLFENRSKEVPNKVSHQLFKVEKFSFLHPVASMWLHFIQTSTSRLSLSLSLSRPPAQSFLSLANGLMLLCYSLSLFLSLSRCKTTLNLSPSLVLPVPLSITENAGGKENGIDSPQC